MALQFSLASVDPSRLTKPIDFPGIEQKQLNVEESRLALGEKQRELGEAQRTRSVYEDYIKQGGDLFTPTGLQKAATDLRGKLPATEYMKLGPALQQAQKADMTYRTSLQKLTDDELAGQFGIFASAGPKLQDLYTNFQKRSTEAGTKTATDEFERARDALLGEATPLWSQSPYGMKALQTLKGVTPEQVPMYLRMSGYSSTALKEESERRQADLRRAQAERATAEAAALGSGKDWKQFVDTDGNTFRSSSILGRTQKLDKSTGEWSDYAAGVPATAKPLGAKGAGVAEDASAVLTPEENNWLAQYTQITGKAVPGIPAGAANKQARIAYLKEFVKMGQERGYDGSEAGAQALQRDASREALKRLTTQSAAIETGEKDLQNVMGTLKDELKKVGGPDSPVLRKYMNRGLTEWLGDPAFTGVNAAWANFQETAARVFSGQTGAGGTPVSYLKLAQESLGTNPNLQQVMKLDDTMNKLFSARRKATEDTKAELLKSTQLPAKPESPKAVKDEDAVSILRREYDTAVAKANDAKMTDEQRARARSDARAVRAELKRLKVDVPEPGEPTTKPAAGGGKEMTTKTGKKFTVTVE